MLGYGVLWALGVFSNLGFHGTIAAVLGVLLASLIGIGLMGLLFYSDQSGYDASVSKPDVSTGSNEDSNPEEKNQGSANDLS